MAVALDTLQIAKDLRAAKFDDVQAEAIAHALLAAQEAGLAEVATKKDLLTLSSDLRLEMADLKGELRQEMAELKGDLRHEITLLRGELREEIVKSRNVLIMWLVPLLFGQTAATVALIKLVGV